MEETTTTLPEMQDYSDENDYSPWSTISGPKLIVSQKIQKKIKEFTALRVWLKDILVFDTFLVRYYSFLGHYEIPQKTANIIIETMMYSRMRRSSMGCARRRVFTHGQGGRAQRTYK